MHLPKLEVPSVRVLVRGQSKRSARAPADLVIDPRVSDFLVMASRQIDREPKTEAGL